MNINVRHYANPEQVGYIGWIEPDDESWIVFISNDNEALLFASRDPDTGAVIT